MANEEKRVLTARDIGQLLGKKVAKLVTRKLTAPGDNYGSVMLSVDATLDSGSKMALVAKMFPLDEMAQRIFQNPKSMKKEIGVYQVISPEYHKIQEEQSVPPSRRLHAFCSCPGARLTLGNYDEEQLADENSVLLLENLKEQGYRTGDRISGLDLKHTEFVLERLARFHATAVAIKQKKPLVFRNKLLKILTPFKLVEGTKEDDVKNNEKFIEKLRTIPACYRNVEALSELFMDQIEFTHSDKFLPIREPYATFMHFDFWTNNMMFKYKSEVDEEPVDFKIVDFQVSQYGSPVPDLMLFLFTSTQKGIVPEHIDRFLELYHNNFLEWLKTLGCETKMFSYTSFLKEVKIAAPVTLPQIVYMLMPITFNKEQIEKFGEGFAKEGGQPLEFNGVYITKISEALDTYVEKGWL
ncbi:hypothetical protein PR048_025150 [Dryococelus australis]|uniref:CHK kinase-like domain-containing protein n=1 Tax=Dryococelus australis TaxID=614101 RepID=A0ABQ9GQN0_9NEOP|nr:hypothetical protein PR048_025150 [Dryococelus australis]